MTTNITDQNLGKFLQIVFSDGVRNQISEDYRDWEFIQRIRQGDPNGREQRFFFQSSYGPSAIQWAGISPAGSYPSAQQVSVAEHTALYKEINATIELEYNLWNRARKSPAKYAEPLAIEISSKAMSAKRRLSADLYGDGTGVLGSVADVSASVDFTVGTAVVITLDSLSTSRGHVGWFEFGDKVQFYALAGTEHKLVDGAVSAEYGIVLDKDRVNNQVTVAFYDASDNLLTIDGLGTVVDTDVLYREPQVTKPDLTAIGSTDYNTLSEVYAGLESLAAADGRVVHGITMSGASKASQYDCSNNPLDVSQIQRALSQVKTRVGEGRYSYKGMLMAPEANDVLIESREVDRRFQSVADNKRGVNKFVYVHGNDSLEVLTSEFCPKKRIYMLPEAKGGQKVLEFYGSDFEPVRPAGQGSEFFLRPGSSGGHDRFIRSYLEGICVLIAKHPAAILQVKNFSL
jgi:hypothetical protein